LFFHQLPNQSTRLVCSLCNSIPTKSSRQCMFFQFRGLQPETRLCGDLSNHVLFHIRWEEQRSYQLCCTKSCRVFRLLQGRIETCHEPEPCSCPSRKMWPFPHCHAHQRIQ